MASDLAIDLGAGTVGRRRRHEEAWKIHLIDTGLDALTGGRVLRLAPLIGREAFTLTYGDMSRTCRSTASWPMIARR
jgi:glucose-1-phosphate cytidylyltransferase